MNDVEVSTIMKNPKSSFHFLVHYPYIIPICTLLYYSRFYFLFHYPEITLYNPQYINHVAGKIAIGLGAMRLEILSPQYGGFLKLGVMEKKMETTIVG